jgi:uncharacterized protein YggE
MRTRLLFLTAVAATALEQTGTDTNTITITASRNVTAAPDQVVYTVGVRLPSSAGLSDAVAQLAGTGITAAELLYTEADATTVTWSFQHAVPFTAMKDTNAMLAKLSQHLGAQVLSYSVTSLQTTPAAQSQVCQLNALMSDARREADRLAAAAGVHVGGIVGLSDQPAPPTSVARLGAYFQVVLTVTAYISAFPSFVVEPAPSAPSVPCSLIVQFRLLP